MDMEKEQIRRLVQNSFPDVHDLFKRADLALVQQPNARSFWSEIFSVSLNWKEKSDAEQYPSSLFLKVPKVTKNVADTENTQRESVETVEQCLARLTARENLFYKTMGGCEIPHFPIPKVYYCEDITGDDFGGMAADDLSSFVYSVEYVPGFTDGQVLRLMEALAGLHYFSMEKTAPATLHSFDSDHSFPDDFLEMEFEESMCFETLRPEWFENRIQRLKWAFGRKNTTFAVNHSVQRGLPMVMVHFDMNATNVLWRKGTLDDHLAAIIDFQTCMCGPITLDIIRVLTLGLPVVHRRQHTERYIAHYYNTLKDLYGKADPPYSIDDVHKSYEEIFAFGSNFSLFGLSLYVKMYKGGVIATESATACDAACEELLSRAKGIVEDVERFDTPCKPAYL